jgi:hypothetical protein
MCNLGRVGDSGAGASGLATPFGVDEGPSAVTPEFPADWEHGNTRVGAKVRLSGNGFKDIGASNDESSNLPAINGTKALVLECQSVRTHAR